MCYGQAFDDVVGTTPVGGARTASGPAGIWRPIVRARHDPQRQPLQNLLPPAYSQEAGRSPAQPARTGSGGVFAPGAPGGSPVAHSVSGPQSSRTARVRHARHDHTDPFHEEPYRVALLARREPVVGRCKIQVWSVRSSACARLLVEV